jgi:hypothetical protein
MGVSKGGRGAALAPLVVGEVKPAHDLNLIHAAGC